MEQGFDRAGDRSATCRYGISRLPCRGPKRDLDQPYISFVGSTEFYGRFIEAPLPALVEQRIGEPCVNFGVLNGGIEAFVNDPTIVRACSQSRATVLQVMGANFLSNRFYMVHPRRNDRFLRTSTVLDAIYPDVDFADFTFTRHMLTSLHETCPQRFDIVISELREAWSARMRNLISQFRSPVILAWFSLEDLDNRPWHEHASGLAADPLFVTRDMLEALRPLVADIVDLQPSRVAVAAGTKGMVFTQFQRRAAQEMLGPACHAEASEILSERLRDVVSLAA